MNDEEMKRKAKEIKFRCASLCIKKGKGHLSSALSCAEIVTVLYYNVMRVDPANPKWPDRDRFVMSKNHGSVITYPILQDLGFFSERFLNTYQDNGSILGTHAKISVPGIDFGGGSLGIGLGAACGMACAAITDHKRHLIFCMVGDCEMEEGSIWEAIMFAGHRKLSNLIMIVDRNKEGCTDYISELVPLEPLKPKLTAFGWDVREVTNGHDIPSLQDAFSGIRGRKSDKPLAILIDTIKGNGVSSLTDRPWMHGQTPTGEQGALALSQLREDLANGL